MLVQELSKFNSISLETLNEKAPLNNRFETKFVLTAVQATNLLAKALAEYDLLVISDKGMNTYQNNYFDSPSFDCYFQHHNGVANRFKIRRRFYHNTNTTTFELKCKRNNGQTTKTRTDSLDALLYHVQDLKQQNSFMHLQETVQINYDRITLLHRSTLEKVTLDYNYNCSNTNNAVSYNKIVFAEVKSISRKPSVFAQILKQQQIRPGSLSKYCLGLLSLNQSLKHNNFKQAFQHIINTNNYG